MLKKIFMLTTLILMLSSNCFAIGRNDFSLGGIYLDMPKDAVIKMYGQPTSQPSGYAQLVSDVIKYGNDVEIGFLGNKVRYVVTTANNGWKTAAGVRVGMSLDEVIKIYGNNYQTESRTSALNFNREYFYANWIGTKYTWSRVSENYSYNPGDTTYRISVVVSDGKVTAVELNQITPEY